VAELGYDSGRKEREGRFAHGMGRKREREVVELSIRAKICGGKVFAGLLLYLIVLVDKHECKEEIG
jgi:hypothetical protein